MNFNDALTHAKNHYLPEELAKELVLGLAYDPSADNKEVGYPAYVITLGFIPANIRNPRSKSDCNDAGDLVDGYSAFLFYYDMPDNGDNGDNGEYFYANTPDELLAELPDFAGSLNYQVYEPTDPDLNIDLSSLARDLFPDLPSDDATDYKTALIAHIEAYNSGILPTGITMQDIEAHFEEKPTLSLQAAFDDILTNFESFASGVMGKQMLGVVAAPKDSVLDFYIAALVMTPAEYRVDMPHTTDRNGEVCHEYQFHLQGGSYGKPATLTGSYSANSIQELIDVMPAAFKHVKYSTYLMSNGHRRHNSEEAIRKMFPTLLGKAGIDDIDTTEADLEDDFAPAPAPKLNSEEDLLILKKTALEVIRKSNF